MRPTWAGLVLAVTRTLAPAQTPDPDAVPGPVRAFVVADRRFEPKLDAKADPKAAVAAERDPRDRTAKIHDFVGEQGLNPVVLVLTRSVPADDGVAAKVAKGVQALVTEKSLGGTSLAAEVVFLTLENEYAADMQRTADGGFVREVEAKKVADLAAQLGTPRVVFAVAAKTSATTTAWGLTAADDTVVVVYNRLRIVKRFPFPAGPADDAAVKAVLAAARGEAKN